MPQIKTIKTLPLLALMAAVAFLAPGESRSVAGQRLQVIARISNPGCQRHPGKFFVPAGRTAVNFRVESLAAGVRCHTRGRIKHTSFSIANGNYDHIYRYPVNGVRSRQLQLELPSGRYFLYVGGGDGARAILSYELR